MKDVRIGLIGTGGMGKAHATAFKNVPLVFGNEPARPVLEIVADLDAAAVEKWAGEFGFNRWTTDWREVVARMNLTCSGGSSRVFNIALKACPVSMCTSSIM